MNIQIDQPARAQLAARFVQAAGAFTRDRLFTADMLVQFGASPVRVCIRDGAVVRMQTQLPPMCTWDFAVRASEHAWQEFWRATPAPGWHDIFALSKRGELEILGNLQPLMANLQYVKDLLAMGREETP